jgi:hypothetical protein
MGVAVQDGAGEKMVKEMTMRYSTIGFLMLSTCVTLPLWAADPAPTTAPIAPTVSELRIQKKSADDLAVNLFGSDPVQFVVVLSRPDQIILGVDEQTSKLLSATDDKGTDLTKNGRKMFGDNDWLSAFFSKVAKDSHKIAIPLKLGTLPDPQATVIQLKADFALKCGHDVKTEEVKPFDLTTGTSAKFGTHTMKVSQGKGLGGSMFGALGPSDARKKQSLSVELDAQGAWLKSLEFIDEKGNVVATDDRGSQSSGDSFTRMLELSPDVKSAGLRVTYFQTVDEIHQPIDMKVGVGLP